MELGQLKATIGGDSERGRRRALSAKIFSPRDFDFWHQDVGEISMTLVDGEKACIISRRNYLTECFMKC